MPGCRYQAQDMTVDETGDNISELSSVIKNPSAEGFLAAANTTLPGSASPVRGRTESIAISRGE